MSNDRDKAFEELKREEWRVIPGVDIRYEVSSLGRVRSWAIAGSKKRERDKPKIMRQRRKNAYKCIGLRTGGKYKMYSVHTLVLLAFNGEKPAGHECCHINGDPADNRVGNLRWGTSRENAEDQISHGKMVRGSDNGKSKLTGSDIPIIRKLLNNGFSLASIGRRFNVTFQCIQAVRDGVTWKHI